MPFIITTSFVVFITLNMSILFIVFFTFIIGDGGERRYEVDDESGSGYLVALPVDGFFRQYRRVITPKGRKNVIK